MTKEMLQQLYPELCQEIFNDGYQTRVNEEYSDPADDYADWDNENPKAIPQDSSERFSIWDSWSMVMAKGYELIGLGYTPGNRDWVEFMKNYEYSFTPGQERHMYIAWNPTHMQFAVESDPGVIDELYPHLVNAEPLKRNPNSGLFDMSDDTPF